MPRKGWRETAVNPQVPGGPDGLYGSVVARGSVRVSTWAPPPSTAIEALMEAAPHQVVRQSREEQAELSDLLVDAIDSLPWAERTVFDGLFVERATYRELAARLDVGLATVDRIKERAVSMLRTTLDGKVDEWLTR